MRTATRRPGNLTRRLSSDAVPITVRPTRADVGIANAIARNTEPAPEVIARGLTWGADEKVLLAIAAVGSHRRKPFESQPPAIPIVLARVGFVTPWT